MFVEQFASRRKLEKQSDDLYLIVQRRGERLQGYEGRFKKEKVSITHLNIATTISAFHKGLLPEWDLYKELTKYPCKTMEDILAKAWAQIKWEEDEANRHSSLPHYSQKSHQRVAPSDKQNSYRKSEPYPLRNAEAVAQKITSGHSIQNETVKWINIRLPSTSSPLAQGSSYTP